MSVPSYDTGSTTIASYDTGSTARASYDSNAVKNVFFDGVNDSVDCAVQVTLWSQSKTKFSFALWIYPLILGDNNFREVIRQGWNATHAFVVYNDGATQNLLFVCKKADATEPFAAVALPGTNRWIHIACVYDNSLGSANIKMYVNGTVGPTTGNLTEVMDNASALTLSTTTTDFNGFQKDFRWYTTKALSAAEVTNIFNDSASAPTPDYWLKLNDGVGNPVDSIGGLTATLSGGAEWRVDAALVRPQYSSANLEFPGP